MQYILSQEEYDELRAKQRLDIGMQRSKLQKLCTKVADTMPVSVKWINQCKPEPWGCILTAKFDHCCDECPVQEICPHEHKEWSK
jgi:hypothetical protein